MFCCDVASKAVYHQDVVPTVVLSEVEVQGVAWKDVEHVSVGHLYRVLSVTLCIALAGITSPQFFLCILVHSLPPDLPAQLLDHPIITTVSVCMCYIQYVVSFFLGINISQLSLRINDWPPFKVVTDKLFCQLCNFESSHSWSTFSLSVPTSTW